MRLLILLLITTLLSSCIGQMTNPFGGPHQRPDDALTLTTSTRDGNTYTLKEGTYGTLDFRKSSLGTTPVTVVIEGAGKDKTILDTDRLISTYGHGHTFIIKNLTVIEPQVISADKSTSVIFVNAKIVGKLNHMAYRSYNSWEEGARISFLLCDFFKFTGDNAWFIGPSRVERDGKLQAVMKTTHFSNIKMTDIADNWHNAGGDYSKRETKEAFFEAIRQIQMRTATADIKSSARDTYNMLAQIAKEHGSSVFTIKASPQEIQQATNYFNLAKTFSAQNNYLLESYSLNKAFELAGEELPALKNALAKNKDALAEKYGCDISLDYKDRTPSTYMDGRNGTQPYKLDKQTAVDEVALILKDISPLFVTMASPKSRCKIELISNVDHFIGKDTGSKVVSSSPSFIESSASKMRRESLKKAAREAAWKSAYARTDAAINNLTSVTQQLHENRNRIESQAGGTYLVLNNKGLQDTTSGDRQQAYDAAAKAQQLEQQARNSGKEFIQSGVDITSTFYMSFKNAYQVDMQMTGLDAQQVLFSPKLAVKTKSIGPCTRKLNTQGIGSEVTGPCDDLIWGYRHDKKMRQDYVQSRLQTPLLEFVSGHVIKQWVEEIQNKSSSNDKSTQLDGLLLSYLIGQNDENLNISGLSKAVLGETLSLEKLKEYSLY